MAAEDRSPIDGDVRPLRRAPPPWPWSSLGARPDRRGGRAGAGRPAAAVPPAPRGGVGAPRQGRAAARAAIPSELAPAGRRAERPGGAQPGGRGAPAHPRRQPGPRPEDPAVGDADRGQPAAGGRWPTWSSARPRPCASRSTTTCAGPAPPPAPRTSGERTPVEPRCWTSWPRPWSGSSRTRASRSTGTAPRTCASRASARTFMELAGNAMENAGKWCQGKVRVRGRGQLARAA